ncbi:MAG: VIT1/CCC1 transporter family protein [Tunicatimonas sp.]
MQSPSEEQRHGTRGRSHALQDYLGEFVYGGIDGSVTTFAVVAGASGAELSPSVIIILGFANLFADGLSMSIGAYLSHQSEKDNYEKHRKIEHWEVEHLPEEERAEIRDIYRKMGFEGTLLEQVTNQITANRNRWVDVMMKDELGMVEEPRSSLAIGGATFVSFIVVGLIPLLIYVYDYASGTVSPRAFLIASALTSLAFMVIGWMKATVTQTSRVRAVLETLLLGGTAATLAYWVGDVLEKLIN